MREAVFVALAVLVATPAWAYSEKDLAKFEALNSCKNCDLSGADLSKADLREANLSKANLSKADLSEANLSEADLNGANLNEAILCKTKMPWGEENSGGNGKPKKSWWQRLFGN